MTAKEIIEKIRAEIERLKKEGDIALQDAVETNDIESGFVCGGIISTCEKLLTKLDTLQEQPVKTDIVEDLQHYLATTPKEQIKKDWESLKEWGKVGPTVSEFLGWDQPVCEDVEEEFIRYIYEKDAEVSERGESTYTQEDLEDIARHFYELGRKSKEQPVCDGLDYKNWDDLLTDEMAKVYETYIRPSYIEENSTQASCHFDNYVARHFYELGRQSKPKVSDGLEEEINDYISKHFFGSQTQGFFSSRTHDEVDCVDIAFVARHFAKWGAEHLKK